MGKVRQNRIFVNITLQYQVIQPHGQVLSSRQQDLISHNYKKTSPKGYSGLATSFLNKYREEKDEKIIAIHIAR